MIISSCSAAAPKQTPLQIRTAVMKTFDCFIPATTGEAARTAATQRLEFGVLRRKQSSGAGGKQAPQPAFATKAAVFINSPTSCAARRHAADSPSEKRNPGRPRSAASPRGRAPPGAPAAARADGGAGRGAAGRAVQCRAALRTAHFRPLPNFLLRSPAPRVHSNFGASNRNGNANRFQPRSLAVRTPRRRLPAPRTHKARGPLVPPPRAPSRLPSSTAPAGCRPGGAARRELVT